ncbi:hypothetical protein RFI_21086 [Reticulomyxa filosa]|uniref:Alkyl sulfatase dimerisation domain-containing protein n=1 Tax=Reticulomyxa filosa TaxID=46433 RepID=X6MRI0_RETFI|nr:hypothetical protein RFI_21086 [Reticulomyxa filosa]|eukprot:ETO16271.1 hypothetical protein RFI_21086 [Reticulomyxa filosa]
MRYLKPKFVVGCHCDYIEGEKVIAEELTLYRDTIAFVHDQTVRLMNKHYHVDDIVHAVETSLPKRMKRGRVQQFYGTIEWSIRAIFMHYLGWFSGEPADLYPATHSTRGKYLLHLLTQISYQAQFAHFSRDVNRDRPIGDIIRNVITTLKQMLYDLPVDLSKDTVAYPQERFILEVSTWILSYLRKKDEKEWEEIATATEKQKWENEILETRWKVMRDIASRSFSANGRNYLISHWLEEQFQLSFQPSSQGSEVPKFLPVAWFLDNLRTKINPASCDEHFNCTVVVKITDDTNIYLLQVRGPVLEVKPLKKSTLCAKGVANLKNLLYARQFLNKKHLQKGTEDEAILFWSKFEGMLPVKATPKL